jgi:hypothetical protein
MPAALSAAALLLPPLARVAFGFFCLLASAGMQTTTLALPALATPAPLPLMVLPSPVPGGALKRCSSGGTSFQSFQWWQD